MNTRSCTKGCNESEHSSECVEARLQFQLDAAVAALSQIAALGTYTAKERPYAETIARMQGEACKFLRAHTLDCETYQTK